MPYSAQNEKRRSDDQDLLAYLSNLENASDTRHQSKKIDVNTFDPMSLVSIINNRVYNSKRISEGDIQSINESIRDYYQGINDLLCDNNIAVEALYDQLDCCLTIREKNGIDQNDYDIPSYVEDQIGTRETPLALQMRIEQLRKTGDARYESQITDLYGAVYALQTYNFSDVSADVTGRRRDSSKYQPSLIDRKTLDVLGCDYQRYYDTCFKERLDALLSIKTDKDVTKMIDTTMQDRMNKHLNNNPVYGMSNRPLPSGMSDFDDRDNFTDDLEY